MPKIIEKKDKEAFVDDVQFYSMAINKYPKNADLFADRAKADIKLANRFDFDVDIKLSSLTEAVADANRAIQLDPSMAKAYLCKGTALLKLEEFQTAKSALEVGASLAPGDTRFSQLIKECVQGIAEETGELPNQSVAGPAKPKYRHDYYQKLDEVVVSLFAKEVPAKHVVVDFGDQILTVIIEIPGEDVYYFHVLLFAEILTECCKYQVLSTKIEICLVKAEPFRWTSLGITKELLVAPKKKISTAVDENRRRNLRKISAVVEKIKTATSHPLFAAKLKKEEREENLDGHADEDERRAKSKSFVEPSGTIFRGKVPQKLERMNEQSIQGSNASLYSVEMLMRELAFEKAKRYSFDELATFTSNFDNEIGSGAFGNVYKGQFSDGTEVAVKVLKMHDFVHHSFLAEIRTMGKTNHQNLIKLIGFCLEENMLALVYEYMENGSLDMILYKKPLTLEWDKLYAIAVELANAIAYLHHDCGDQIIHHDIKASNVLLDSNHLPKLSDFGLANLKDMERTHLTLTKCRGTPGYAAPEIWTPFAPITCKCDVYSFGMILFEILGMERNKRPYIWFPRHVWNKFNSGTLDDLITECGISENDRKKATILSLVALWCAQHTPEARPPMNMVATVLEDEIRVKMPPNPFLTSDPPDTMSPA